MSRKITPITITEENMPAVAGRLKKFFEREDKTISNSWNFDCGFKGYIKPSESVYHYDSDTFFVDYQKRENALIQPYIEIIFDMDDYFLLQPGDKVAFLGDRIITSVEYCKYYQYDMWQICPKHPVDILYQVTDRAGNVVEEKILKNCKIQ